MSALTASYARLASTKLSLIKRKHLSSSGSSTSPVSFFLWP